MSWIPDHRPRRQRRHPVPLLSPCFVSGVVTVLMGCVGGSVVPGARRGSTGQLTSFLSSFGDQGAWLWWENKLRPTDAACGFGARFSVRGELVLVPVKYIVPQYSMAAAFMVPCL